MKKYTVYQHPTLGYEAIKIGWSWPGFLFNWIWALFKKLWGKSALMVVLIAVSFIWFDSALCSFGPSGLSCIDEIAAGWAVVAAIIYFGIPVFAGLKGNRWRTNSMRKRGFKLIAELPAATPDGAIAAAEEQRLKESHDKR